MTLTFWSRLETRVRWLLGSGLCGIVPVSGVQFTDVFKDPQLNGLHTEVSANINTHEDECKSLCWKRFDTAGLDQLSKNLLQLISFLSFYCKTWINNINVKDVLSHALLPFVVTKLVHLFLICNLWETYQPQNWDGAWGRAGWSVRSERQCVPSSSLGFYWGCMSRRPCFRPHGTEKSLRPLISVHARVSDCPVSFHCIYHVQHSQSNLWVLLEDREIRNI